MSKDSEQDTLKPKSKRIFINQVDSYHGKNLAKYLSQCVVGASLNEGEEEEEGAEEEQKFQDFIVKEGCYEIIGTVKDSTFQKPKFIKEVLQYETKEQLFEHISECDVIIYDITQDPQQIDEAVWAVSEMGANINKIDKQKIFILVSTFMTWARSKPLDPDDPDIPFTEDDYRRRKPHPNFKDHTSAEKEVIKVGKSGKNKLLTYVVAAGVTYGAEENMLHYLFKAAWHNVPELPCFGTGLNVLPTIHIRDLAGVLQNVADNPPAKIHYIIAVEDSKVTLEEITKAVSATLSTGKIKVISKEEALLNKDLEQADFDTLTTNLRMDAVYVKDNMHIKWVSETGFVENITNIVKEYKESRNLMPLRIMMLGPPAAGKSTIAKQLATFYKLHHIMIKDVIDEEIQRMTESANRVETGEELEGEDEQQAQDDKGTLEEINNNKEENKGRLDERFITMFYQRKLHSKPCQNQGFIIDGYPKTTEQAKELFAALEGEEEGEEGDKANYDKTTMPEFLFCLDADDAFLKARIMNLPENVVVGTHNTEKDLIRRLSDYRAANGEESTVLNYFDELEVHPIHIDVTKDVSDYMKETVEQMKKKIGAARNYGPTPDELEEMKRQEAENKKRKDEQERTEREQKEREEMAERKRRQDEWTSQLETVKKEEYELLEAQSVPLRNYLMKHVMPTLTQGLIECCKIRPDDAIDYLAEYLLRNNPQIE